MGDWWHTDSTDDSTDNTDPFLPSASVGSAVGWISGSSVLIRVISDGDW